MKPIKISEYMKLDADKRPTPFHLVGEKYTRIQAIRPREIPSPGFSIDIAGSAFTLNQDATIYIGELDADNQKE